MAEQDPAQTPPSLGDLAAAIIAQAIDPSNALKLQTLARNVHIENLKDANELYWKVGATFAAQLAEVIVTALNQPEPIYDEIAKASVDGLFGTGGPRSGRTVDLANSAAAKIIETLAPASATLAPSDVPARQYLNTVTHLAFEGWMQGWLIEGASAVIPGIEKIQTFGELDNTLAEVLGLSRLSRRVLGPFVEASVVTPLQWHVNKQYRPELLSPADAVRQSLRGRWTKDQAVEEIARQGYSDDRIDALFNAQRKFFSVADVRQLTTRGEWTRERGLQHLLDQGYDQDTADAALRLEGLNRIEQLETQEGAALVAAYVSRDIDDGTFRGLLADSISSAPERALLEELGRVKRAVNVKGLSAAEARRLAQKEILAVADYRAALRREGYDEGAVLALELELRADMDEAAKIDQLRAAALAERAAEKAARDAETAARKADIEQQRALARRGPLSKLERAVVRGLIPFSRYEEVLTPQYDADTVAILVADVEQQRADYLAQQAAADAAKQRAAVSRIGISDLEQAVLAGVLTIDEYRAGLTQRGVTGADADILVATLTARVADLTAAKQTRLAAADTAKARSVNLSTVESLVRRGARTMAQYESTLRSLGFDDAAVADMRELLELQIADDAAARDVRAGVTADSPAKGLTLDQMRRGVVLQLVTLDDYARFLSDNGYTTDAQVVLLAEVRQDVADAEAARARRVAADTAGVDARVLPLATVRRAARLSLVSPTVYTDRLVAAGYSADDIDIEMQLLVSEIADVQAVRAARDAAPAPADDGQTLAQLAAAVKRGFKGLDDYRARAVQLGLSRDAVDTQVRVLADEVSETTLAKARRDALTKEFTPAQVPIADLEQAVRAGALSIDDYAATLEQKGLGADDAALLAGLLAGEL